MLLVWIIFDLGPNALDYYLQKKSFLHSTDIKLCVQLRTCVSVDPYTISLINTAFEQKYIFENILLA